MTEPPAPTPVPSPWDLRADLVGRVTADLLGPLDGENEVIRGYQLESGKWSSPGRVRDRYLVGMLAPKGTVAADPERDDDVGPRRATTPEAASRTAASPGWSWPSRRWVCPWSSTARSTGRSPAADGASTCGSSRIKTTAPGRRYGFATPKRSASSCRSRGGEFGPLPVNGEGIVLRGRVTRSEVGPWLVTVFLSNEQEQVEINKDSRWLFQARLELAKADEAAVFLGRGEVLAGPATGSDSEQAEVAQLDLQYRDVVEFAVGHGVGTEVEVSDDDPAAPCVPARPSSPATRCGGPTPHALKQRLSWPG